MNREEIAVERRHWVYRYDISTLATQVSKIKCSYVSSQRQRILI